MTNIRVAESEIVKQAQARQEPKWLLDLREQAFQNIQVLPLPNPDKINMPARCALHTSAAVPRPGANTSGGA